LISASTLAAALLSAAEPAVGAAGALLTGDDGAGGGEACAVAGVGLARCRGRAGGDLPADGEELAEHGPLWPGEHAAGLAWMCAAIGVAGGPAGEASKRTATSTPATTARVAVSAR
jgi:hypothetical protein